MISKLKYKLNMVTKKDNKLKDYFY